MPSIKVTQRLGCQRVGVMMKTQTSTTGDELKEITVTTGIKFWSVSLILNTGKAQKKTIQLSTQGAIDLVTALVKQLNDVTIATADELLAYIKDAKQRSDDDARAVVECLRDANRHAASTEDILDPRD